MYDNFQVSQTAAVLVEFYYVVYWHRQNEGSGIYACKLWSILFSMIAISVRSISSVLQLCMPS